MMKDLGKKHTFVICAYKESPFLEECILSLKKQKLASNIIMITSTPNSFISELAEKYYIPLRINEDEGGIVQDWNFGYGQCRTPYVTIAHQDDIYFEEYALRAVTQLEKSKRPLIYFSDYCEIRDGKKVISNQLLRVKRILLAPLRIAAFRGSKFIRRRSLSLGSGICCPAVTYAVRNLPNPIFTVHFRSDEDWEAWERLSRLKGDFIYDATIQMGHRIHEESETTAILGDHARAKEDYEMFCRFWPEWIARIMARLYSESEKSNKMDKRK